ncbi:MAG: hypothetical protein GY940_10840, partial [bacterium]|nr:hypothetical protein [bacterium]
MSEEVKTKKIAVIVPSQESRELYNSYLTGYGDFVFEHFSSLEEFNRNAVKSGGCNGFIIDLKAILRSSPSEKEYFHYLLELFPSVRISHSPDKNNVNGDIRGRLFTNENLFDYFFNQMFPREDENAEKSLILIVSGDESRELYQSYLEPYPGIRLSSYPSVEEFHASLTKTSRYSGFVIDLRTMMKAGPEEKSLLHELIDSFPAV